MNNMFWYATLLLLCTEKTNSSDYQKTTTDSPQKTFWQSVCPCCYEESQSVSPILLEQKIFAAPDNVSITTISSEGSRPITPLAPTPAVSSIPPNKTIIIAIWRNPYSKDNLPPPSLVDQDYRPLPPSAPMSEKKLTKPTDASSDDDFVFVSLPQEGQ